MKFNRIIKLITAFCIIFSSAATSFAAPKLENSEIYKKIAPPEVFAKSAVLVEKESGAILFEKNADMQVFPASTTKILTSLVFLEYFEKDDVITVGREINEVSLDSSKAGHIVGESMTAENLIRGLIIPSGNDSGVVAACSVARKIKDDPELGLNASEQIFSDLLNAKAIELGCIGTNFTNPHGYHDDNHYTTASDMAKIALAGLDNEIIKQIASERSYSGNGMGEQSTNNLITQNYNWKSHNLLITDSEYSYPYANGFKTGFTDEAGDCVVATAEKDGIQLIAVIFDSESPNRWIDAVNLFEYGFSNFGHHSLNKAGDILYDTGLIHNKNGEGERLNLVMKEDIEFYMPNSLVTTYETELVITNNELLYENKDSNNIVLKAPIEKDAEIGKIVYKTSDGTVFAESKLYAANSVEEAPKVVKVTNEIKESTTYFVSNISFVKIAIIILIVVVIIVVISLILRRRRSRYYSYSSSRRRNRRSRF